MIQHSFGLVGQHFEALLALARERNLLVIEDCAHALGARWQGQKLGTFGDAAVFSFERSKIITTIHGGMAVVHGAATAHGCSGWPQKHRCRRANSPCRNWTVSSTTTGCGSQTTLTGQHGHARILPPP
ncbi:DegT/DnrJ/EryC1/StrS family aminotransferase [Craterilacuibacter sp.]|uniref:DegT/DnrJ/EryC1/StrS family aminotransferase n=1 Tax=Craterilacuibacter sp. TaxID=2870909 RepID=UPI003F30BDF6